MASMDLMSPVGSHSLEINSEQTRGKEPMYNNFLSPAGGSSGKNKFKRLAKLSHLILLFKTHTHN